MSLSSGTLASSAGSGAGIHVPSALPTITCFSGSHSFQLLTIVLLSLIIFLIFYNIMFWAERKFCNVLCSIFANNKYIVLSISACSWVSLRYHDHGFH